MSTTVKPIQNTRFKTGWLVLMVLSVLAAINHIILIFVLDEPVLFIGWAAFNLYSTLVLYIPFRQGEKWSWYTSWILVVGFASMIMFDPEVGLYYLVVAVLMVLGLLLTRSAFIQKEV